jgi:ACS family hexuronate transporter-like MFS transporter
MCSGRYGRTYRPRSAADRGLRCLVTRSSSSPTPRSATPGPCSPRSGRFQLRWLILGITALVLVLNYADRAALGVAGPRIIDDLGLTKSEFGLLSSIFFVGYAPFCFIGGWLSDRYGPRSIMGIAVGWWSIFTALTAAGAGFMSMLLLRFLFGFGEGPQGAVSRKTMRNWSRSERWARRWASRRAPRRWAV